MTQQNPPRSPQGGPAGNNSLAAWQRLVKRADTVARKLEALDAAELERPEMQGELIRGLRQLPEARLMGDSSLQVLKIWAEHRRGRRAERDYYLHALESSGQRREARRALGISTPGGIEQVILLVTVDCMRGDRLGVNGCAGGLTPCLDALGTEGVNYPRAYSTAGQTAQSFPGILMSNFFQNFGTTRVVPRHLVTLPQVLSGAGYRTVAYNAANPHVSHFYGYDRGFDEFHDFLGQDNFNYADETFADNSPERLREPSQRELMRILDDCQAHPDIYDILRETTGEEGLLLARLIAQRTRFYPYTAADMVKGALRSLRDPAAGPKLFLWLHLMDLHENITVPWSPAGSLSTVQQFFLNSLLASPVGMQALRPYAAKYAGLYDTAVGYVDRNLQILRTFLREAGLWERCLMVVTADHGQELLERGVFGHGYDRLAEGVVHVPLVFSGGLAGALSREDADRPVSTLDIAPTVLQLCGTDDRPDTFLGKTLNDTARRPVYGQTFYDGADNRCGGPRRAFELKPWPAPVKECCVEKLFCIKGGHQVVHDRGSGTTEVHPLRSARGGQSLADPPDAEAVRREAEAYLEKVYQLPREAAAVEMSSTDEQVLKTRLGDLGYL